MPNYQIYYFCNECADTHPFPFRVRLDSEVDDWATINDTYAGIPMPPDLGVVFQNNGIQCPATGGTTTQTDRSMLFLVRLR